VEAGPPVAVAALVVGILAGERIAPATANIALVTGAGALGAAWFVRAPMRVALAACACALLGAAWMSRALEGQRHSSLQPAIDRRAEATVTGDVVSDPTGRAFAASVLVRVGTGRGAHRTLLASASGDETGALRAVEAGDHVVLAGRRGPLHGGALDDRARWRHAVGRLDEARVLRVGPPEGLLAAANAVRSVVVRGTR